MIILSLQTCLRCKILLFSSHVIIQCANWINQWSNVHCLHNLANTIWYCMKTNAHQITYFYIHFRTTDRVGDFVSLQGKIHETTKPLLLPSRLFSSFYFWSSILMYWFLCVCRFHILFIFLLLYFFNSLCKSLFEIVYNYFVLWNTVIKTYCFHALLFVFRNWPIRRWILSFSMWCVFVLCINRHTQYRS